MMTEELHAAGVADKIRGHEKAAHEKRNWVRLTYDCNNRCVFCLDSDTHDGEIRSRDEVKEQILDGRRKGAERLILSGGEPTMHPDYIAFIKLGRLAGYKKVQTVTNGRMFKYREFLRRCLDAGLTEITFSLHGPNARIHDALVGVKGAFDEEIEGLRNALADGRPIVNVDIVINRGNVKQLPEMLRTFYAMGVREFDLLQVIPFGRAFTEGRETLFYDLEEMQPYLREALEFSRRPDVHLWMNRFPPAHLEGFEHLIQDPYKLNDEVRGRKEEYARLLDDGTPLDCRAPDRCKYCYLQTLCDTLDDVREQLAARRFEVVRYDTEWEARQPPVYGGDPASARRARDVRAETGDGRPREPGGPSTSRGAPTRPRPGGKVALPVLEREVPRQPVRYLRLEELVEASGAVELHLVAPDFAAARAALARMPTIRRIDLELADVGGLVEAAKRGELDAGLLDGRKLVRVRARTAHAAEALCALPVDAERYVYLTKSTAAWLRALPSLPARLALAQPTYERLTDHAEHDADLEALFRSLPTEIPVEGVPPCVLGRMPRTPPKTLDASMLDADGRLEIFRYTRRFIEARYFTKSRRCATCAHTANCAGLHINYVRAHGYAVMRPVPSTPNATTPDEASPPAGTRPLPHGGHAAAAE
jgi:MoaA/NifB/PqqE/SkfB family radical SAM enzyme